MSFNLAPARVTTMQLFYIFQFLAFLVTSSMAQAQAFEWSFSDPAVTTDIEACKKLSVNVTCLVGSKCTGPYYMLALVDGGIPRTSLLGQTTTELSWFVDEPIGSSMLLTIVDAEGKPGQISSELYTVIAGASKSCITTTPTTSFTFTANVTKELSTCDPWGLSITGGAPPYTVTLASIEASSVTNSTLDATDNLYIYINRASPGAGLLAAVSDSKGQWAAGTIFVQTKGGSDYKCDGAVSSSGQSSDQSSSIPSASITMATTTFSIISSSTADSGVFVTGKRHNNGLIIVVCLVAVMIMTAATCFWLQGKRRKAAKKYNTQVQPFKIEIAGPPSESWGSSMRSPMRSWYNFGSPTTEAPPARSISSWVAGHSSQPSESVYSMPMNDLSEGSNTGTGTGKMFRSRTGTSATRSEKQPARNRTDTLSSNQASSSYRSPFTDEDIEEEETPEGSSSARSTYVIQHRDASFSSHVPMLLREIPPPYSESSSNPAESSAPSL
ncbi:hypothetical protein C8J56DRAFT_839598 [Mycena floridula]|nr:hypothetical protein C8J56DRAFT_839598 [Mycena floridula]